MYCSNCGAAAAGNFCSQCGRKLLRPAARPADQEPVAPPPAPEQHDPHAPIFEVAPNDPHSPIFDADELITKAESPPSRPTASDEEWADEIDYKTLIRHPDVRDLLGMAGNRAKSPVSGEEFIEKFDSVVPGVSIAAKIAQPLYSQWGVKTGKTAAQQFDRPVGKVIVAILCALAEGSSRIRNVTKLTNGCCIEASIPSDIWSFEGVLTVQVQRHGKRTFVEAATNFPGQLFDFGKSQRFLDQLLGNIRSAA